MTNGNFAPRQLNQVPIFFNAYLPLKQHSEPEDGAIEEEGSLADYVLREDLDWESEED